MHSPSSPGHGIEPLETLREETPSPGTPLPVLSPVVEDEQDGPEEGGTYFAPIHFGPRPAREQGSNGAQTSTESTRLFTGFGGGNSHYSYEGQQLHPAASNRSPGTGNQLTQAFSNTSAATTEKLGRRDSLTTAHNTISADRSDVETGEPPLDVRARRASAASTVSRTRSHNMTPVQSPTVRRDGRRPSLTTSHNTFGTDRSDTETGEPSLEERKRRSSETLRRQKSYEGVRQSVSHQSHPPPVAWNSRGSRTLTPQSSQQSYATAQGDVEKANRPSTESRPSSTLSHTRSHNGFGVDERQEDEVFVEAENNGKDEVIVVTWDNGDEDPMNPRSWPRWRKWAIVIILSIAAFCVTSASTIYSLCYGQITAEFNVSRELATAGLSLFVFGLATGPLVLAPLSEFYGRRKVYLVSYVLYIIWLVPTAVARNIQTVLVSRYIDGFVGSAFLSVSGGSVGDLFCRDELQEPMMLFTAAPFLGPAIGPVLGGFINRYTDWRWTFYMLLIWAGVNLVFLYYFVPETYHPALLRKKARHIREVTKDKRYMAAMELKTISLPKAIGLSVYRPMQLICRDFMIQALCLYSAILLGILYLFFGAFPLIFRTNHDFDLQQQGMTFLGIFIGMILGALSDPIWHRIYNRLIEQRERKTGEEGVTEPEFRLPPAIAGSFLVPISLFWFGWTTYRSVNWIVPLIGSIPFGMGTILIYSGVFTFLVDAYPLYAASALGANLFARCGFAAAFPLFGVYLYENLGFQWASTLLALLMTVMLPFPYLFFRYGKMFRHRSRFASAGVDGERKG